MAAKHLNGKGGSMKVYGMKIDNKTDSFEDYLNHMETSEQELIKEIGAFIDRPNAHIVSDTLSRL